MTSPLTYGILPLAAMLSKEQSKSGISARHHLLHTLYEAGAAGSKKTRSTYHPYHQALTSGGHTNRRWRQGVPTHAKTILDSLSRTILHQGDLLEAVLTVGENLPVGHGFDLCVQAVTRHVTTYAPKPDIVTAETITRALLENLAESLPGVCEPSDERPESVVV